MNERIKLLAEQAGAVYSNDHAVSLLDDEIEKFAELIVKKVLDEVAFRAFVSGDTAWSDDAVAPQNHGCGRLCMAIDLFRCVWSGCSF